MKTALISVWDKVGIVSLAQTLIENGYRILSTGGTAKHLSEHNIPAIKIAHYTEFPEIMGGRVKTLHPKIFGGILARRDHTEDIKHLERIGGYAIDMVVVNLYPFPDMSKENLPINELLEYIDIGGVSLIRAAAKNYKNVTILVDPKDYVKVEKYIREKKEIPTHLRKKLAVKAFYTTYKYDKVIYEILSSL